MKYFKIYLKNNYIYNVLVVLLSLMVGIISIKMTSVVKLLYSVGILNNDKEVFLKNFTIFMVIIVGIFLIKFASHIIGYRIHWDGMKNMRVKLFNEVLMNDYSYMIDHNPSGVWNDINLLGLKVAQFYKSIIVFVGKIIECVLFTYLVFKMNYTVGIVLIIIIPIVSLSNIWVNKKVGGIQTKLIQKSRESAVLGNETITSIDIIKTKNLYDFFLDKIQKVDSEIHEALTNNMVLITYWNSISKLVTNAAIMIVIYLMIFTTKSVNMQIGDVIALYTIMPLMTDSYKNIFSLSIGYSGFKPSLNKINEIINYRVDSLGDKKIEEFQSLELDSVKINYDDGKTIEIPNLKFEKGEKVLIAGESGAGKSSMFNIITGLNKDYDGAVRVNGIDIKEIDIKSLRRVFGISFQDNPVFNMTIEENIKLGRESKIEMNKIISTCMLERQFKEKGSDIINGNTVSGGEKSRLALAQNLYGNPDVVMIDESLSSIDEETEEKIMHNLVNEFSDKTILCISHRKESRKYFDKVINFENLVFNN